LPKHVQEKLRNLERKQIQLINSRAQNKADYFISAIKIPETGTVKTEILLSLFRLMGIKNHFFFTKSFAEKIETGITK